MGLFCLELLPINRKRFFKRNKMLHRKEVIIMLFVITIGIVIIAITCLSIEANVRKSCEQNKEIIELLKGKEK